jgi:23S rRNA (cytosine1962-C5)-methyltransferase
MTLALPYIVIHKGREKSLARKHPWLFASAVAKVSSEPIPPGSTVAVRSAEGICLGYGAYNAKSQIRVRMWTFSAEEMVDADFVRNRVKRAVSLRSTLPSSRSGNSQRLIFSESDGLPGVILDRFGSHLVLQLTTAGAFHWRDVIIQAVIAETGCASLEERSDSDTNHLEGLDDWKGLRFGSLPTDGTEVQEHGLLFKVRSENSQKTGFYLDQRDNRLLTRSIASGKRVLDCFCFTGGFAVNALKGGATHVTLVDSSADALAAASENMAANGFMEDQVTSYCGNAFELLRRERDASRQYDLVILDPPKFAPTTSQVEKAARAYKDINMQGIKCLAPGGLLMTYSCSGGVSLPLFQKIVADAALDAGKELQIIRYLHQAEDHPIHLAFPESEYLKGLLCQAID